MQHVKIPQDRIGVLIGEGGETMREIEERAEVRLDIDSEDGSVKVESVGDPVTGLKGPDIVKAIGRGFAPEDALALLEDDMMMFEVIDIEAASRNKNDLRRHKGRLIGEGGRTRELMQDCPARPSSSTGRRSRSSAGPNRSTPSGRPSRCCSTARPTGRSTRS